MGSATEKPLPIMHVTHLNEEHSPDFPLLLSLQAPLSVHVRIFSPKCFHFHEGLLNKVNPLAAFIFSPEMVVQ